VPCAEKLFYFRLPAAVSRESDGGCDLVGWDNVECVVHEANEYEIVVAFILEVREAVAMPALVFHWNSARFNL